MNTPLVDYYGELCDFAQQEQTARAQAHAKDSTFLVDLFLRSVETVEGRPPTDESFHDRPQTKRLSFAERGEVVRTIDFVRHLVDGHSCTVTNEQVLSFHYLDREISPARTKGAAREKRRALDVLLANSHDHMPVFGEIKIAGDKLPYSALVQLLMLAAEFQSPAQRKRLQKGHDWGKELYWPENGPFADLYIIGYEPSNATYREHSFKATEQISERLMKDRRFARFVRRIAYLEARMEDDVMAFEKHFAFGSL